MNNPFLQFGGDAALVARQRGRPRRAMRRGAVTGGTADTVPWTAPPALFL
jgi:hypothetical protein